MTSQDIFAPTAVATPSFSSREPYRVALDRENFLLNRIVALELKLQEFISAQQNPTQKLFFDNQVYDAYSFLVNLIVSAKHHIALVDGYISKETLDLLSKKNRDVSVSIFTLPRVLATKTDLQKFNTEYPTLEIYKTTDFHDRFLIIDQRDVYQIGASLKDAGIKCFAVSQIKDQESIQNLLLRINHIVYNTGMRSPASLHETPPASFAAFRARLLSFADDDYREFVKKGVPCDRPILGVRVPQIRALAKVVPAESIPALLSATPVALEEVLFRGFLISRLPYGELLCHFDSQISLLDNWCAVDTFCASLRPVLTPARLDKFFTQKVSPLLKSRHSFAVRAGLVFLLDFYLSPDYLPAIFEYIELLKDHDAYYVKMAIAWLLAEALIKFPDDTLAFLAQTSLPKWTFNKAISKACDSRRLSPAFKDSLRALRK